MNVTIHRLTKTKTQQSIGSVKRQSIGVVERQTKHTAERTNTNNNSDDPCTASATKPNVWIRCWHPICYGWYTRPAANLFKRNNAFDCCDRFSMSINQQRQQQQQITKQTPDATVVVSRKGGQKPTSTEDAAEVWLPRVKQRAAVMNHSVKIDTKTNKSPMWFYLSPVTCQILWSKLFSLEKH